MDSLSCLRLGASVCPVAYASDVYLSATVFCVRAAPAALVRSPPLPASPAAQPSRSARGPRGCPCAVHRFHHCGRCGSGGLFSKPECAEVPPLLTAFQVTSH